MNDLSVTPRLLIEYVHKHRDDGDACEAMARYLSELEVRGGDWGGLRFTTELQARWSAALADRERDLERLRTRVSDADSWLDRAATDFADLAAEGSRALRLAAQESTHLEVDSQSEAERLADGRALLDQLATTAGSGRLPAAPVNRESPGSEELMSCRAEHIFTLERAEGLLRDSGRLDFTAPSETLRRLATVNPGPVGGRSEPLSTMSSYLDELCTRQVTDSERVSRDWQGETATAFGEHGAATAESLRAAATEFGWLAGEAEAVWRLLDGLLRDVAEAIAGQVASVGDSRIARIVAAVELVEDVNGYSADAATERAMWGGLSGDALDAAVQVLYKRVWYLANAMDTLVNAAGEDAAARLDNEGRAAEGD